MVLIFLQIKVKIPPPPPLFIYLKKIFFSVLSPKKVTSVIMQGIKCYTDR